MRYASKRELAMAYFPDSPGDLAVKSLQRLVREVPGLRAALAAEGYRPKKQQLSPKVEQVYYRYLGKP